MPTVSINIGDFEEKVSSLNTAALNIKSTIKSDTPFEKTNIKPFTKDVEAALDAIELLKRYQQLLLADIDSLEHVGQEMKEHDEQIASATGPQIMR